MTTFQTEFTTDGSAAPLATGLIPFTAGNTEILTFIVEGFEDGDDIEIDLYAKLDPANSDSSVNTVHVEGELVTPARYANARQATFSFTTNQVARLLVGRFYEVRANVTRDGEDYSRTVATGFIGAVYPGNTVTAPSDEAYLRALGDATAIATANAYTDDLLGPVASVSPTSPNRTIAVVIDGTTYYIHAKTTNN